MYVKLNMADSLSPLFLWDAVFSTFSKLYGYNLQAEEIQFQDMSAIINLTLRRPYAILLSDYPNG